MSDLLSQPLKIAILGPTASGKTSLASSIAKQIQGVVINGDPFQAYRDLPIGTGQPTPDERANAPHIGYGCLDLSEGLNPATFGETVRTQLDAHPRSVLVTGSGLYLRGIWNQLSDVPDVSEAQVAQVRRWLALLGAPRLHRFLQAVDPTRAQQLHPNDGSRIQRALGLHLATGQKPSLFLSGIQQGIPTGWKALLVLPSRESQQQRIAKRVQLMTEMGWEAESQAILASGLKAELTRLRPLGYLEWLEDRSKKEKIATIKIKTQQYAKRQATFFKNQWPEIPTFDPDQEDLEAALTKLCCN